jgi:hypothetical protein
VQQERDAEATGKERCRARLNRPRDIGLGSNSDKDKDAATHRAGTRSGVRIAHGRRDWTDQRVPQINSKERIEEVTERGNKNGRASSVMGRIRFR